MSLNLDFENTITSKRLTIRSLTNGDVKPFMNIMNRDNQDFSKSYTNYPTQENAFDIESSENLIKVFDDAWKSINARILYIFINQNIIGALTLSENEDESASVSYFISKEFRGNGYASEAQYAVLKNLSRQNLSLSFMAQVFPENEISIQILRKNGFEYIGDTIPTKNRSMGDRPVPTFVRGPVI